MQKENYRWIVLAVISVYALCQSLALQSVPPVLSLMIKDFGISHAEAGLAMALCGLPGMFLILPLSFNIHRLGSKKAGLIALALNVTGIAVTAAAPNVAVLLVGRTIQGMGAVALPLVGTQGLARWFVNHRLGLAMGIYTIVFPLSGIIAMTTFGAIGLAWGWRSIMWALFALNIASLILFAIYFQNPPLHSDEATGKKAVPFNTIFKMGWPIWALAATWGVSSLSNNAVGTFTPDFLYQNGFDLRIAGIIFSITLICGLIMSPVVGYISDRSRYKEAFLVAGGLIGTLVLLLLPVDIDRVVLYMIILGVFTGPAVTVIFAMAATLVKSEIMPLAYGAVASCSHAGMFIGPYVSGFIRDVSGSYQYSYWFASVFFLVVAILTGLLLVRKIKINRAARLS